MRPVLRPARAVRHEHPRAVRLLLAAAAITYVGDEVTAVALALTLHASGASGAAVAALFAVKLLPVVVLAPLSGWVTDRYRPDVVLGLSAAVSALVVVVVALSEEPALWLVGTGLLACAATVAHPALMVLLPRAAGPESRRRVMSWAAVASRSSSAGGALLAGVLVAAGGLRLALLVDALTYLVVVVVARAVRLPDPEPEPAGTPVPGRPALAGLRLVATDPVLRVVLGVLVATVSFVGISYVAVFFLVRDALHGGPTAVTAVLAAYGAGMTVGCLVAGRLPVRALALTAVRAPLVIGVAFLAPVVVRSLPVAVVGFALAGLSMGAAVTAMRGLVVERVPTALLGRVWAAESALGVSGEVVALLTAGVVVTTAGPLAAVALCGGGALLAGLVGAAALRRDRLDEAPLAVAVPAPRAEELPVPAGGTTALPVAVPAPRAGGAAVRGGAAGQHAAVPAAVPAAWARPS